MTPIRLLWLALCVAGTVLPMRHFVPGLHASGYDVGAMVAAWQANWAVRGLLADLAVTALTLAAWIVWDCARRRDWWGLVALPAIPLVGVSLALPLHLLLRSR